MKVYGSQLCPDCRMFKAVQAARGFDAEFTDITASTANLKQFLIIRDSAKIFDEVKANQGIGIPLFVNDNGDMSFDMNEALSWINQAPVSPEETYSLNSSCEDCR